MRKNKCHGTDDYLYHHDSEYVSNDGGGADDYYKRCSRHERMFASGLTPTVHAVRVWILQL